MSQIFEAIRRAESERPGKPGAGPASATELLKHAEEQVRTERQAEIPSDSTESRLSSSGDSMNNSHGLIGRVGAMPESLLAISAGDQLPLSTFRTLHLKAPFNPRLVVLADKKSAAAEAFRLLGVRLKHLRRERALRRLLICSTATQEGKSMISANVACTLAATSRQNVLLIEGDIRRPSLSDLFGIEHREGLCEYSHGKQQLSESVYRLEEAGVWLMPAGTSYDGQTDLMHSDLLSQMIQQLSTSFHWIIIDSPPILPLADTSVWARLADSILLVARTGVTEKRKLERGIEALDTTKLVGAVLNSALGSPEEDYYYYRDPSVPNDVLKTS